MALTATVMRPHDVANRLVWHPFRPNQENVRFCRWCGDVADRPQHRAGNRPPEAMSA